MMKPGIGLNKVILGYTATGNCLILLAILLFPFSFFDLTSAYFPNNQMCGSNINYYKAGDCSISYSYIALMIALLIGLISYNFTKFSLKKRYIPVFDETEYDFDVDYGKKDTLVTGKESM
eukprot:Pgem_evm2s1397